MRRVFPAVVILMASFAAAGTVAQQSPQTATSPQGPVPAAAPAPAAPATSPAPGTPAKPWVPVAASTLAAHPDAYYGQGVSLTGVVELLLSKSAFSVDQGKSQRTVRNGTNAVDGADSGSVLIIAPTLQLPVDAHTYVTVLGEVVRFDPVEMEKKAKDYKIDLSREAAAKYQGHTTIIATSVINAAGLDIAKRLPPPMTTEEEDFQRVMRQVGPANAALRGAMDKLDAVATKEQAAILTKAFTQTETFWKAKSKTDAVKWATEARAMAESIDKSIAAGKWEEAKTSVGTLGQQCQSCHGAYRERFDDGSFRIKTSAR